MGALSKFESMMQGIVEGSFGKVFRSRLQEVELASKLSRAMDSNVRHEQHARIAPNFYQVHLSSRDFEYYRRMRGTLKQKYANALISVAKERGYKLNSVPIVNFLEDLGMVTGETRIDAQFLDANSAPVESDSTTGSPLSVDATRSMSPAEAQALARQAQAQAQQQRPAEAMPPAWLTLIQPARSTPKQLTTPVIHLGRHPTNDIIVNDKRVSRHHAEVRYERGQFVLYDLGSTNGVGINGVTTHQPVPLKNNDRVTVGSHEFVFQRR
jgi:hypothetical protein